MTTAHSSAVAPESAWQKSILHRIGSAFVLAAYACVILVALSWFASPSRTMAQALDPEWTATWSLALGVFGVICIVCRISHRNVVEGFFSGLTGVLIWVWSLIVINLGYHQQPEVLQAGWALMAAAGLAVGWGTIEVAWSLLQAKYETLLLEELTRRVRARAAAAAEEGTSPL